MPTPTSLRSFWINWPCARRPVTDDASQNRRLKYQRSGALDAGSGPERTGVRRLPWLLDILLYPANLSGIITLGRHRRRLAVGVFPSGERL